MEFIAAGAVALLMPLMMVILRKLAPLPEKRADVPETDSGSQYVGWYILYNLIFLLFAASLSVLWTWMFTQFSQWRYSFESPAAFTDYPSFGLWLVPGLLLGLGTSIVPVLLLFRLILGKRYAEFMRYADRAMRYDQRKLLPAALILVAVLVFPIILFGLNAYTRFAEDQIVVNRLFSLNESQYSYDDIEQLAHFAKFKAPNGNIVDKPYFMITFENGDTWSTRNRLSIHSPESDAHLFDFLSRKTGLPIEDLQLAP